jgi:DnaK suppressor protein
MSEIETFQKIRDELLARRTRLQDEMARRETEQGVLEQIDTQAELVDIAQSVELIERNTTIQDQESRELEAINQALSKMSQGGYGDCEDCDEPIPERRLMVVPEATLCARCQAIRERERARVRAS